MKICQKCGFQLPVNAEFCRSCGAKQSMQITSQIRQEVLTSALPPDNPHPSASPTPGLAVRNTALIEKKTSRAKFAIIGAVLISTVALAAGGYIVWGKKNQHITATAVTNNQDPNRTKTVAGELLVVEKNITIAADGYKPTVGDGGTLTLGGQVVFDAGVQHIDIMNTFNFTGRTVVLFSIFDMGSDADTSLCRFMTVHQDGKTAVTNDSFECGDVSVTQEDVTVTKQYKEYGSDIWKFSNGELTQISKHDFDAENIALKNAARLEILENLPMLIHGTLKLDSSSGSPSNTMVLMLPKKTYISSKVRGSEFCNVGLRDSLPINLGNAENRPVLPPAVQGEAEFVTIISCQRSGPVITTIRLVRAESANESQSTRPSDEVSTRANNIAAVLEQSPNTTCQIIASSIRKIGNSNLSASAKEQLLNIKVDAAVGAGCGQ